MRTNVNNLQKGDMSFLNASAKKLEIMFCIRYNENSYRIKEAIPCQR